MGSWFNAGRVCFGTLSLHYHRYGGYITLILTFKYISVETTTFFDLLSHVVQSPAPTVSPTDFSPEFSEFVALCLQKDPDVRPSAQNLFDTPFLKNVPANFGIIVT